MFDETFENLTLFWLFNLIYFEKGTNDFFAFLRLIKDIFEKFKDIILILKCVKITKNENLPLFPLKNIEFWAHLY